MSPITVERMSRCDLFIVKTGDAAHPLCEFTSKPEDVVLMVAKLVGAEVPYAQA